MKAPSIAIARLRVARVRDDRAKNAALGRLMSWCGIAPMLGTVQRVAWERERGHDGYANRGMRRAAMRDVP